MRSLHPYPFGFLLANLLVNLVRHHTRFVLHHMTDIGLVLEDGSYCLRLPVAAFLADVGLSLTEIVEPLGVGTLSVFKVEAIFQ